MLLYDRLQITSRRSYTDEGYLIVPARIGRTGTQEYLAVEMGLTDRDPSEKVIVYRPPEEVFSDESLQSFASKPVTNNHPPVLLDASNVTEYSVGLSDKDVIRDGDFVSTTLNVVDASAIALIEDGKVELSNGYVADIDFTPGVTPDGQNFDAIQTNIRGNHIAIVTRGRAGAQCRVADHANNTGGSTVKVSIQGVDYEVSDQAAQAVNNLIVANKNLSDQVNEKEEENEQTRSERDKAVGDKDAVQAKLDDALSKVPDATAIDKLVSDRAALVSKAVALVPDLKWEGKDDATVMAEVVAAKCTNVQMDSKTPEYIKTRFEILTEDSADAPSNPAPSAVTDALNAPHKTKVETGDSRAPSIIAREKKMVDSREAYKYPRGKKE